MPKLPDDLVILNDERGMQALLCRLEPLPAMRAARAILSQRHRLLLCTGFPVCGCPETDGPAGTIALAHALQNLKREIIVLSWDDALEAMEPSLGEIPCQTIPRGIHPQQIDGVAITIEVCGRTIDGAYLNMLGNDVINDAPWFEDVIGSHALVSIGDCGNEYGMGSAPIEWFENRPIKRPVSTCDILVVGQVSNWAALAVVAALSVESKKNLLPAPDDYQKVLDIITARGVVDGVTRRSQATEDGFDVGEGVTVLRKLHQWVSDVSGI